MLIRRMYLSIKCECVALIFFLFCGFLFTEIRKETLVIYFLTTHCKTVKMKEPNISQLNIFPLVTYAIFISIDKNACSYLHTN